MRTFVWLLVFWKKYRYWLIALTALIWLSFFDSNNLVDLIKLRVEIGELKEKREYYSEEIIRVAQEEKKLFSNDKNLEKFAREKYLMKKDGEDIYVFPDME